MGPNQRYDPLRKGWAYYNDDGDEIQFIQDLPAPKAKGPGPITTIKGILCLLVIAFIFAIVSVLATIHPVVPVIVGVMTLLAFVWRHEPGAKGTYSKVVKYIFIIVFAWMIISILIH